MAEALGRNVLEAVVGEKGGLSQINGSGNQQGRVVGEVIQQACAMWSPLGPQHLGGGPRKRHPELSMEVVRKKPGREFKQWAVV